MQFSALGNTRLHTQLFQLSVEGIEQRCRLYESMRQSRKPLRQAAKVAGLQLHGKEFRQNGLPASLAGADCQKRQAGLSNPGVRPGASL